MQRLIPRALAAILGKQSQSSKQSSNSGALAALGLIAMAVTIQVWAEKPLASDADIKTRDEMVVMARQIGVTCTYCHNLNDFRSSEKKTFQVAKEHMRIVKTLNSSQGFNGKPKIDCYTCHRGEAKYAFHEAALKGQLKKDESH